MSKPKGGLTCPKLQFQVKPDHFEIAKSNKSDACSVAEAMKERYPHLRGVSVDLSTIRATDPEKDLRYIWFTPPAAQAVITMTDPDLAAASGLSGKKMTKPIWVVLKPEGSQVIPVVERRARITQIRLAKAKLALERAKAAGKGTVVLSKQLKKLEAERVAANAAKGAARKARRNPVIIIEKNKSTNSPRIVGGVEPPRHVQHTVTRRSGARRLANFDFGRLTG